MTEARIIFTTSGTLLRNLLPSKKYRMLAADTTALAILSIRSYRNESTKSAINRDEVRLEIPGVAYQKADRSIIHGRYLPAVFENSAEAISANRELLGYPSVFSDIEFNNSSGNEYSVTLSQGGIKWASICLHDLEDRHSMNGEHVVIDAADHGILLQRYIPGMVGIKERVQDLIILDKTSSSGNSDASGASTLRFAKTADIDVGPSIMGELLTIQYIVERLAELPVFAVKQATLETVQDYHDLSKAYAVDAIEGEAS